MRLVNKEIAELLIAAALKRDNDLTPPQDEYPKIPTSSANTAAKQLKN